jgi:hypothetical protein
MMPEPVPVVTVTFDGLLSTTLNVSSGSTAASPVALTITVLVVCPGVNVTVPEAVL